MHTMKHSAKLTQNKSLYTFLILLLMCMCVVLKKHSKQLERDTPHQSHARIPIDTRTQNAYVNTHARVTNSLWGVRSKVDGVGHCHIYSTRTGLLAERRPSDGCACVQTTLVSLFHIHQNNTTHTHTHMW